MSSGGIRRFAATLTMKIGHIVSVDDEQPPRRAAASSPVRDWLLGKQRRYAWFLSQGSVGNNWLVLALGLVVASLAITGLPALLAGTMYANDIEIPLRAAEHWSAGGQVYPASAMLVTDGPNLPFLYPPFLLPLIVPFSHLPHEVVWAVWVGLTALVAVWTCRRLGMPWLAVPFALLWPQFFAGIFLGNVQIWHFAAFVALLYVPGPVGPIQKRLTKSRDVRNGLLAAGVGALKVLQLVPVLYMARRRFRAAVIAILAVGLIALIMLPFTGLAIYGDWWAQLNRANDPSWHMGGVPLSRVLGQPDLPFELLGLAIILIVRGRDSAAWLGIAMVIMTPSIHDYGFLFVLPALMTLRRDLAIPLAALFLGYYHTYAWYLGVLILSYILMASQQWDWLRAPGRRDDTGDPAPATATA
jgi:hypothetical protein